MDAEAVLRPHLLTTDHVLGCAENDGRVARTEVHTIRAEVDAAMVTTPASREAKIRFLAEQKFPDPYGARLRRRRLTQLRSSADIQAEQYLEALNHLSDSELEKHYENALSAIRAEADREEAARAFNQPHANADVSRWAQMPYWTLDEAVALSLGRDPRFVNWETVQQLVASSRFAFRFADQREIVNRARTMGQLRERTTPATFIAWAERMQFPMPDELVNAVKSVGNPAPDWKKLFEQSHSQVQALTSRLQELEREKTPAETAPLDPRERESLLKLVIGMAIGGYSYEPNAKRSTIVGEIVSDLLLAGMSISEDTVRRHLASGKELLPKDETE
jgi:hypothetical protein